MALREDHLPVVRKISSFYACRMSEDGYAGGHCQNPVQELIAMERGPVPDGYHSVTPYLKLPGAGRLLEFLTKAFGGVEIGRLNKPDGSVLHAEVRVGDTLLMIHELPAGTTPKPSTLYHYVADVDAAYLKAIDAGATPVFPPTDMYYGARTACITDVSGNDWWLAMPREALSLEEIQRRATAFLREREAQTQEWDVTDHEKG